MPRAASILVALLPVGSATAGGSARLNDIQTLGTRNSYKLPMPRRCASPASR
ncbi:phosphatidylinositol-specific phospholipase C1-like protein [Tahibacter soli]|uniref:Phosphatidylinositol-specific phospholipase C1-like protein n=1 Tax=Tahibacter soli TaxID=2983605 RepID=A0A9X3YPD8_9GAMM|nr:phosphatidylinositol-specific phospholipase C1-like protein [Tahibacter soli]MDC8016012.1 phosphatidylinositol-specific phospholipase C1-like protein [Tahibacter soli]